MQNRLVYLVRPLILPFMVVGLCLVLLLADAWDMLEYELMKLPNYKPKWILSK